MQKKTGILAAVGGMVLIALLLLALPLMNKEEQPKLEEGEIIEESFGAICTLSGAIERLEIKEEESIVLGKDEGKWVEETYPTLNYNQEAVQALITQLQVATSEQIIHHVQDLEKYGIRENAPMLTLYNTENEAQTLIIGGQTPNREGNYVWNETHQALYVVHYEQIEALYLKRADLMDKKLQLPKREDINEMVIEEKDEKPIVLQKGSIKGVVGYEEWQIKDFFVDSHAVSTELIESLFNQLEGLQKDGFVGAIAEYREKDLLEPTLKITLNSDWSIQFGKTKDGSIYFTYSEEPYVYTMLEDKMRPFMNLKPIVMIRKEVYMPQLEGLEKVILKNPEESFILEVREQESPQTTTSENLEEKKSEYTGKLQEHPLTQEELEKVLSFIGKSIRIEMLLKNPQIEQKENRKAEVTVQFDYKDGTSKCIELVPYDINFYILRVDGIVEFAASKQPVMELFGTLGEWMKKE
ncbi:hypothetical protein CS063_02160 [Sporanaerobium hydrogeniformans]|uniref:Uncharacterized protein n=1 Tax=Sporanaerobium hydrogeniformans TaxID=3072179 RepID=A0AC61DL67_9FIRM|nr:DUF4340 domain-containing protein [Sporanaerobium hydrogeniformans]PHV72302.1 hypothetical protein CS063_02160 [Sporanaerobium hydrogeniformans]